MVGPKHTTTFTAKTNIQVPGVDVKFHDTIRKTVDPQTRNSEYAHVGKRTSRSRLFVLASSPGSTWWFGYSGTPMRGADSRYWPTLRDKLDAKRRWTALVLPEKASRSKGGDAAPLVTKDMLKSAEYFDCPADKEFTGTVATPREKANLVAKMEAVQVIGRTCLSDGQIRTLASNLSTHWDSCYDGIVWNSQHFALRLAALVLTADSFDAMSPTLQTLDHELYVAAAKAYDGGMVQRHLSCMAGMAISGSMTFGVGAFLFWAGAGVSMGVGAHTEASMATARSGLDGSHERFRIFR